MRISDWSSDVCSSDLSFDLQRIGDDATAFKIFVSEVDLAAFPADVAERIRSDCATQAAAVDQRDFIRHIERFEARGVLDQTDADAFIKHFVERLISSNRPPLARTTLATWPGFTGPTPTPATLGHSFNPITPPIT